MFVFFLFVESVRTVFAAALATVTAFEVVLFSKNHVAFIAHVVVFRF